MHCLVKLEDRLNLKVCFKCSRVHYIIKPSGVSVLVLPMIYSTGDRFSHWEVAKESKVVFYLVT